MMTNEPYPEFRQVVLDTTDTRRLAEFYRELLGLRYLLGDEPNANEPNDADSPDWLVLTDSDGVRKLAFQQVAVLPEATWPEGPIPQQLHLDFMVRSTSELEEQHRRVLDLGARVLLDGSDDPEEPIWIYADPAGHPFCIFVGSGSGSGS